MSACVPTYSKTLRIPFETAEQGPHLVDVPIDGLMGRWSDLDLDTARFYHGGQSALPAEPVDQDADGTIDVVRVSLDLSKSTKWLMVVSPSDDPATPELPSLPLANAVSFDFARARR